MLASYQAHYRLRNNLLDRIGRPLDGALARGSLSGSIHRQSSQHIIHPVASGASRPKRRLSHSCLSGFSKPVSAWICCLSTGIVLCCWHHLATRPSLWCKPCLPLSLGHIWARQSRQRTHCCPWGCRWSPVTKRVRRQSTNLLQQPGRMQQNSPGPSCRGDERGRLCAINKRPLLACNTSVVSKLRHRMLGPAGR